MKGDKGDKGEIGPQGPTGATPTVAIGAVTSGELASVTANPTETGIPLDFTVPVGPTGPQGEQGEIGPKGDTGDVGPQRATGVSPQITVAENTKTSYKVRFKTDTEDLTSPNLKSNMEYYNADLSATGSKISIPLINLVLTAQNTLTTSLRLTIQPLTTGTSVLADIRRVSIYDSTIETQTNNNVTISNSLTLDDLVYTMSQEMHWMRIRSQDPNTKLWSMCEVRTFASQNGSRTSICVDWLYTGVNFTAPSTS